MELKKFNNDMTGFIVGPLTTTLWEQDKPYNYCLEPVGESTYAMGCTAIGGAQIMRYHKHPLRAKGTLPAYNKYSELDIDGYEYKWGLMPDQLSSDSSLESITTTSNFIYHVAFAATSYFGPGTPGNSSNLLRSLIENFKYDKNVCNVNIYSDFGYSFNEIESLIKEDLDLNRPVLVGIPGHVIVCDGYNDKGEFSFNYGWGYPQYILNLGSSGADARGLTLGLRPSQLETLKINECNVNGVICRPGDKAGIHASISAMDFDFNGFIRVVLSDNNNVRRSFLSSAQQYVVKAGETAQITFEMEVPIDATYGDRQINMMYSEDGKDYRLLRDKNGEALHLEARIEAISSNDTFFSSEVVLPDRYQSNEKFNLHLLIESSKQEKRYINCFFADKFGNAKYKVGQGSINFKAESSFEADMELDFSQVPPQRSYPVIFTESASNDVDSYMGEVINYKSGAELLHNIYIQNPSMSYGDVIYLAKQIDVSRIYYDNSVTYVPVTIDIRTENLIPYNALILTITNGIGDIYASANFTIIQLPSGINDVVFKIQLGNLVSDKQLFFSVMHINNFENRNQYCTPANENIVNPIPFIAHHRNFYDFLLLEKDLISDKNTLNPGEAFEISSSLVFDITDPIGQVVGTTLTAVLKNNQGDLVEIGSLDEVFVRLDKDEPFKIGCKIPEYCQLGSYNIYIKATKFIPTISSCPNEMVMGVDSNIKNTLEIEIIA